MWVIGQGDEVAYRAPVARRFGRDHVVVRVKARGGRGGIDLEGEGEDASFAVEPIVAVAVGRIEIAGLLGGVAVQRRHSPPHLHESGVIVRVHVGGHIVVRVAIGPEDQLAVGVEADRGHQVGVGEGEVADGLRFRLGEGRRAAVGGAPRVGTGAQVVVAPAIAVVAVEVHAPGAVAVVAPVLAPIAVPAVAQTVVFVAVGIDVGQDPDLPLVDQVGDAAAPAVVVGEVGDEIQRLLDGEMLAGVGEGEQKYLRLRLVTGHVIADLHGVDVPPFDALPDDGKLHDLGMIGGGLGDLGQHLGVGVIRLVVNGELQRLDAEQVEPLPLQPLQLVLIDGDGHRLAADGINGQAQAGDGRPLLARRSADVHGVELFRLVPLLAAGAAGEAQRQHRGQQEQVRQAFEPADQPGKAAPRAAFSPMLLHHGRFPPGFDMNEQFCYNPVVICGWGTPLSGVPTLTQVDESVKETHPQ